MTPAPPVIRLDEAVERMGDKDIYVEIAHFFAGHLLDSLTEIESSLALENMPEAARLVHSMKSNCATVGAEELRERCYALEMICRAGDVGTARQNFASLKPDLAELPPVLLAIR